MSRIDSKIKKYLNEGFTDAEEDERREIESGPAPNVVKGKKAAKYFENFLGRMKREIERKYKGDVSVRTSGDEVVLSIDDDDEGESFTFRVLKHRYWEQ